MASGITSTQGGAVYVTSIVNAFSSGSVHLTTMPAPGSNNIKETLSGALTANTLASVLSLTGAGRANWVAAQTKDATARTIRLQIIRDGVTIFDATTDSLAANGYGILGIGGGYNGSAAGLAVFQPIDYASSFVVKVASSLTETDKISLLYNYETRA